MNDAPPPVTHPVEALPTPSLLVDATGVIEQVNAYAEALLGYPRAELVGRPVEMLLPERLRAGHERYRSSYAAAPAPRPLGIGRALSCLTKDGRELPVEIGLSPLATPEGCAVLVWLIDLTERREAEERLRLAERMVESATSAMLVVDCAGRIQRLNAASERLFGWGRDELVGEFADLLVPVRDRSGWARLRADVLADGEARSVGADGGARAVARGGSELPIEASLTAFVSGPESLVLIAFADISERVQARAELERRAQELEVAREAAERARAKAEDAARFEAAFLANMSHEIRTPMNGIIGMITLLLDTQLDLEQREFAQAIEGSADALLGILNDILDFSKIEAGKLDIESVDFDLRAVVEDVADLLAPAAQRKGLEFVDVVAPEVPAGVRGDPHRVRQVLINLGANAVKFTEEGEVVLRVSAVRDGSDGPGTPAVRFEVVDTGIGIAPAEVAGLFQAFSQADASTTRTYGGTGLGLAISKQLVELMGGRIGMESEAGRGSTFWCVLPLEQASADFAPPVPREDLHGVRVLVVDDNATNRAVLMQLMSPWGVHASSAGGGEEALTLMRRAVAAGEPFDVALLDFHMPGTDGLGLAHTIAQDPALASIHLVLVTSSAQRREARRDADVGLDGYLTKPVRRALLYQCLAGVMGTGGALPVPAGHPRPAAVRTGERPRLLLVEDNPVNRKVAVKTLERLGYDVDVADNGADGVEATARTPYAAVLMDCHMPVMDGYRASTLIREQEIGGRHTPIIAMTASAMAGDRERCLGAGMDDYVSKPVAPEELAAVLERWTRGAGRRPDDDRQGRDGTVPAAEVLDPEMVARLRELDEPGGPSFLAESAELFAASASDCLAALAGAIRAADPNALADAAHRLRGASANIGARTMAEVCDELEQQGSSGVLTGATAALARLGGEFARVSAALERACAEREISR